jgi:hypothetical protein
MWQIHNPAYWWALLALSIPIIIHLYNRRQTKVKVLGTLRWLKEVQPAQWNFRRIHQWPLLFIRLLLLTAIILLLVDLYKNHTPALEAPLHALILIHPAAGDTSQYRQLAAGWQNDTVKVHWLATGFPPATKPANKEDRHLWSLVAEADMRFRADSIHMIAPNRQAYFTGTPPYTTAALSWELTEVPGDSVKLLWAKEAGNEPELLWFRTSADLSEYYLSKGLPDAAREQQEVVYSTDKKQVDVKKAAYTYQVPINAPDTLIVAAIVSDSLREQWQIFQKAIQATAQYHQVAVTFVAANEGGVDWLIKMNEQATVSVKGEPALVFHYKPGKSAEWLESAGKNRLNIRKELSTAQVLEGGFLEALRPHILAFKYKEASPVQADFRQTDLAGGSGHSRKRQTLLIPRSDKPAAGNERFWLGLLALTLITLERIWPKKIS